MNGVVESVLVRVVVEGHHIYVSPALAELFVIAIARLSHHASLVEEVDLR